MRALINEYGAAVAACAAAAVVAGGSLLLTEASEREVIARQALDDAIQEVEQLISVAMGEIIKVGEAQPQVYADDPAWGGSKPNFDRRHNARRAFTLKDARPLARCATQKLREAWDLIAPPAQIHTPRGR